MEFSTATQSLAALKSAAYRFIGRANCDIAQGDDVWICKLAPTSTLAAKAEDIAALEQQFRDTVADENLREQIANRTDGVRNVILSLAFGGLVDQSKNSE